MRQQCPKCGKENVAMTGGWASSREFAGLKASYEHQWGCPSCGNRWNTIEVSEADLVTLAADLVALAADTEALLAELAGLKAEVAAALKEDEITYRIEGKGEGDVL